MSLYLGISFVLQQRYYSLSRLLAGWNNPVPSSGSNESLRRPPAMSFEWSTVRLEQNLITSQLMKITHANLMNPMVFLKCMQSWCTLSLLLPKIDWVNDRISSIAELQADTIVRGYPNTRIASLRLHWAVPDRESAKRDDPVRRRNDLWGWVHHDSAAEAFLLAITAHHDQKGWTGHEAFFICAPDTADERDSMELYQTFWSHVPIREGYRLEGKAGFFDCSKAKRLLGWEHRMMTNL